MADYVWIEPLADLSQSYVLANGYNMGRGMNSFFTGDIYLGVNRLAKATCFISNNYYNIIIGTQYSAQVVLATNSYYSAQGTTESSGINFNVRTISLLNAVFPVYNNQQEAIFAMADGNWSGPPVSYPITYHYTNSTVTGPPEAAVGDTVTVSAVPDAGYGITDASTQILVTNNDVAVPYTWDATNNRITFTMPDPS